ncbi:MAG: FGGY-family carbohydrate kinase [Candidatus Hydrogenedentes bacterium]|nr:FGGY-family carbohydrate kinase [Candidatus Hydrogenedentota bacterium]
MYKKQCLLGIDLGTTFLKVSVFDRTTGRVIAQDGVRLTVRELPDGGREQDMPSIMRVLKRIARKLKNNNPTAWKRIAGIGVASQGGSSIIVSSDGTPRTPMLLWNDARAQGEFAEVLKRLPLSFWREVTLRDVPAHGMARISWLLKYRPEVFKGRRGDVLHVGAGDYLFFLLTGTWRQEAGSTIQIGPYNVKKRTLDERPLKAFGLSIDFVPPLRIGDTTELLSDSGAALLDLNADIPVAGPYIDQEAGYRCAAVTVDAPLHVSLGTAWVGNFLIDERMAGYAPYQLLLPGPDRNRRLIVLPLLTGNATWEWALREFTPKGNAQAIAEANTVLKAKPFPHAGLHLLPWNAQDNPLLPANYGGGAFIGMNTQTTRDDMLSAAALGLVCEFARVFSILRDKRAVKSVVLSGGASKGEHFRKLMATLLAPLPVYWQTDSDLAGARGALVVFESKAAQAELKRVPLPDKKFLNEARNRASEYNAIIDRLYGHVKAGRPYALN